MVQKFKETLQGCGINLSEVTLGTGDVRFNFLCCRDDCSSLNFVQEAAAQSKRLTSMVIEGQLKKVLFLLKDFAGEYQPVVLMDEASMYVVSGSLNSGDRQTEQPPDIKVWFRNLVGHEFPSQFFADPLYNAGKNLWVSESIVDRSFEISFMFGRLPELPGDWMALGFWGYGCNSYALYVASQKGDRTRFLRMPLGGVYMSSDEPHKIMEFLALLHWIDERFGDCIVAENLWVNMNDIRNWSISFKNGLTLTPRGIWGKKKIIVDFGFDRDAYLYDNAEEAATFKAMLRRYRYLLLSDYNG